MKEKIESGEWQVGYQLPSEKNLSAVFGVSRITVRQALRLLQEEGHVVPKQGLGSFVGRSKLKRDPVPLYHKLKDLIKEKIEGGEWKPGYQLPSETDLSAEYGVSRVTVRQATQLLAYEGLVERKPGLGTFVGRPKVAQNLLSLFIEPGAFLQAGSLLHLAMHRIELLKPPPIVATRLRLSGNEKVYKVRRIFHADDEAVMLITTWMSATRFPGLGDKGLDFRSIKSVLKDYGIEITRQRREVEVTIVDDEDAKLLQMDPGAPALLVTYLSSGPDQSPFEFREMIVRGDRCKYFVDLETPEPLV